MKPGAKTAVICFWFGSWPEDRPDLGAEYVRRLRDAVYIHSTEPVDFFAFVDREKYFGADFEHICQVLIPSRFHDTAWNFRKISMFSSWAGLRKYEWILALDLDIILRENIDFLITHRSKDLVTCKAAYQNDIGGSIISFDPNQPWCDRLTWWFLENIEALTTELGGSERFLYRRALSKKILGNVQFWQDEYPDAIKSFKVDGLKHDAPVIRFHGRPRPHETGVWNDRNGETSGLAYVE